MIVFVNGEAAEFDTPLPLESLIEKFSLQDQKIAIELNQRVVRKKDWASVEVNEADRIEIVHFVGGG